MLCQVLVVDLNTVLPGVLGESVHCVALSGVIGGCRCRVRCWWI